MKAVSQRVDYLLIQPLKYVFWPRFIYLPDGLGVVDSISVKSLAKRLYSLRTQNVLAKAILSRCKVV
jgi:hypothetical protein